MKMKTLTSRFFKVVTVIMATVFATFAFAGCGEEERRSVESSEIATTNESTIQETVSQEATVEEPKISEVSIPEESINEPTIEESSEISKEISEESQSNQEEKYTIDEIKEMLPIYDSGDGNTIRKLGEKDIVVYARYINQSGEIRFKKGDIVGIVGKDKYDECVFWISGNGHIGVLDINYFEYLKDYIPKEGEVVVEN